jgi:hypothetical protein
MGPPGDENIELPALAPSEIAAILELPTARILPVQLIWMIRRHYSAGVKEAEDRFIYHSGDEDSVTGGLGERLIFPSFYVRIDGQEFWWTTVYYKIRGRGPYAPEKKLGADGIFQFEVLDERKRYLIRKGLLFQSKKEWTGSDPDLMEQAEKLLRQSESSIVIDYSPNGYNAISASAVVSAEGNRRRVRSEDSRPLARVLGEEFIGCLRGEHGLYWNQHDKVLMFDGERPSELIPEHFIGTTIRQLQ